MPDIHPIASVASDRVETLLDAAFGTDRHQRTAYRLRDGVEAIAALSFAALEEERLVGTLQSWPVVLTTPEGRMERLALIGPVAVAPDLQRAGIGRLLMARLVEAAEATGHDALMMIGDPEYYDRFFGFSAAATGGWDLPGPFERHRLLARISRPGGVAPVGMIGPDPAALQKAIAA